MRVQQCYTHDDAQRLPVDILKVQRSKHDFIAVVRHQVGDSARVCGLVIIVVRRRMCLLIVRLRKLGPDIERFAKNEAHARRATVQSKPGSKVGIVLDYKRLHERN